MNDLQFTVCVCTRDRPGELRECLASIRRSSVAVAQIVVSDDGDPKSGAAAICEQFGAEYLIGPRRGLCANRNRALAHARGSHVLFLDDDAELSEDFLSLVVARISAERDEAARKRLIVSGRERRPGGHITEAHRQSFLGFQELSYTDGQPRSTVVINAAVFPAGLFTEISFDERITYGYDEVDLTSRAVASGWRIVSLPDAVNLHKHSPQSRDGYASGRDAARMFVTFKRYASTDGQSLRAAAFALLAPPHLVLSSLRRTGPRAALQSTKVLWSSLALLRDWRITGDTAPVLTQASD